MRGTGVPRPLHPADPPRAGTPGNSFWKPWASRTCPLSPPPRRRRGGWLWLPAQGHQVGDRAASAPRGAGPAPTPPRAAAGPLPRARGPASFSPQSSPSHTPCQRQPPKYRCEPTGPWRRASEAPHRPRMEPDSQAPPPNPPRASFPFPTQLTPPPPGPWDVWLLPTRGTSQSAHSPQSGWPVPRPRPSPLCVRAAGLIHTRVEIAGK